MSPRASTRKLPAEDSQQRLAAALRGLAAAVPVRRWLVATDFDGTLSEVVADPAHATPVAGAPDALRALAGQVLRVAVISGRSAAALDALLPVAGVLRLGDYGRPSPGDDDLKALREFNARAEAITRERPGTRLEAKPGSTSIHYRDRPEAGSGLLEALAPLAAAHGLAARSGRMVVEVLPAGWDKAHALAALVEDVQPGAALFAGDDAGDRGCFEYLRRLRLPHLAVGVQSGETDPATFAACDVVVDGPAAWVGALRRVAEGRPRQR